MIHSLLLLVLSSSLVSVLSEGNEGEPCNHMEWKLPYTQVRVWNDYCDPLLKCATCRDKEPKKFCISNTKTESHGCREIDFKKYDQQYYGKVEKEDDGEKVEKQTTGENQEKIAKPQTEETRDKEDISGNPKTVEDEEKVSTPQAESGGNGVKTVDDADHDKEPSA